MKFTVAVRKEGAPDETREVEAASRFAVYELVQQEGATVLSIAEESPGFHLPKWLTATIGTGVKHQEISRMARNLAAMLNAGLSLSRALSVIERQSSNKNLKALAAGLSESLTKGSSFHEALAAHPKVFSPLFIAMAQAGEESGSLADALSVVGLQMERSEELVRKVRGAMIYPSIVILAVIIVGILMMIYVVPTLTKTFESLGVKLPLTTRIIVLISNFLSHNALLVFLGLGAAVAGLIAALRTRRGGAVVLWAALQLPVVGELVRETFAARASRTLSSLLASGVPVLDALGITRDVVNARVFASVVEEAQARVKKGEPVSAAFVAHPKLYPILMSDMLAVGEETGQVAPMLKQIAEFYEADVGEKTKDLSTIVEPVLMLVIGAAVGVFAVSMIGPIYSLSSAI